MIAPPENPPIRNPRSAIRNPSCRICGADLSRAVDDVVRCPSCLAFQVLSLPNDPAYQLVGRHRWVRVLPYLCVFLFWFAVVVTFRVLDDSVAWGLVTAALTLAAWLAGVVGFRLATANSPGWGLPLVEFHLASGVLLASAYHGLAALQRMDTAGWGALVGWKFGLALLGAMIALAVSVDGIRRADSIRLREIADCGLQIAD